MRKAARFLGLAALTAASAFGQDAVVTRQGDGTVVIPAGDGAVTVTTRTVGASSVDRIPRRGVRLGEKQLERFLRDRPARAWT